MFRCCVYSLLLLTVLCLPPALAKADAPQDIRAAYVQLDTAYSRRDIPAVMAFLAPGFACRTWNSTLNTARYEAGLKDEFDSAASIIATTKIETLTVQNDTAEALVSRRVDLTYVKPIPELPPLYFTIGITQEQWQRIDGQWRMTEVDDPPLLQTLCLMADRDQGIRRRYFLGRKDAAVGAQMRQVDAADRARLKQIIRQYGWPGYDLVGTEGDNDAWLIVQHSDEDKAFQKRCLPLLKTAVKRGQSNPSGLAYLTDRILSGEHKPQIYGTQWHIPIAEPTHVDERRAAVGLGPLAVYQAQLKQVYQPSAKP